MIKDHFANPAEKHKTHNQLRLLFIVIFVISACGSMPIITKTPVQLPPALPDLVVSNVQIAMQGIPADTTNCVVAYAPYEIRAIIENRGDALATNIPIVELLSNYEIQIGELPAGQSMEVFLPASSPNGMYNVSVDPQNLIAENDEKNNTFSYLAITPTPPALCPPTETPFPPPVPTSESGSSALAMEVLRYGVYHSPDWGEYQLTDGVYYRTPPTAQESPEAYTTRIQDPIVYGDINADGVEDALAILNTQNGGSGHFIELAAVLNQNGSAYNVSTIYLGDRVVVESAKVENGAIILNMRAQGPNDGLCCPSQPVTWNFVLNGNQLMKLP
jgi:hypothetical protein